MTALQAIEIPGIPLPDRRAFRRDWLRPSLPTVIEGLADDWPARRLWTREYLVERYGDTVVSVVGLDNGHTRGNPQDSVPIERMRLADAAASWQDPVPYYVATNTRDLPEAALAEFKSPALCGRPWWGRNKMWLGPAGTVTAMHQDANDNLFVQLRGTKRFLLFPPGDRKNLYAYARWSRLPNFTPVDPRDPDLQRYPKLARTRPRQVVLQPGQTLFIPRLWWHHASALEDTIGVNFWWSEGARTATSLAWDVLFVARGRYR